MKNRIPIAGIALLALFAVLFTLHHWIWPGVNQRPVRLVITAPEGERFSGKYVADGITNSVSALAPATISLQARNVAFEFKREGSDAEFRVALFVDDLCRTSTTSDKRHGVRGALRYAPERETYWAAAFD
jgi:hypothetical protein